MNSSGAYLVLASLSAAFLLPLGSIAEDTPTDSKAVVDALVSQPPGWEFTFKMPGWLAGQDGTAGFAGIESSFEASFSDVIQNLDMIAAATLEGRHGKLGFILDGQYVATSFGGSTPGPLLSTISIGNKQGVMEGTLTYRLLEGERGWLELLAGARYMYLGFDMGLNLDSAGVRQVSQELSARVIDRALTAAREEVDARLPTLLADLSDRASEAVRQRVEDRLNGIRDRAGDIREAIRDRIDEGIGSPDPGFGDLVGGSGPIRDAIREYVRARADERIEAARAQASAALAAARARIRREAERKLARAETKLARILEDEIHRRIPDYLSRTEQWVDPFVGLRARCNLTERCYAVFRGDVGGFGINSNLTWNLFGAFGYELSQRTSIEAGYRHFQVDYRDDGFTWDLATHGPFVGIGIRF